MYRVVVAGGIASGKSTFTGELVRLGACRIDLDELSRQVLSTDRQLIAAVAREFGDEVVDAETGEVRRQLLARRAFATPDTARRLEELEIPAIMAELRRRLERAEEGPHPADCAVVEIPLLDRVRREELPVDEVVVVAVPAEERLRRAVARGMDEDDARRRMANQPTDEWLASHADTVIDNKGTAEELAAAARSWYQDRASRGWRRGRL